MGRNGVQPAPPELRRLVRRVRLRLAAQHAVSAVLVTIAAALVGVALAGIARWLGAVVDPAVGAFTLSLIAVAALAVRLAREPWSTLRLARRIERRMGWRERLSSALETQPDASVVAAALHREVAALCNAFDARRAAPWVWPGRLVALVAISGLGALATGALPQVMPLATPPGSIDAATEVAPVDASVSVDALLRLADAVEADAARRFDPYLSGVADALRDLGERIERGEVSSDALRPSLEAVLEHLARAYDSDVAGAELAERMLSAPPTRDTLDEASADEPGLDTLRFSAAELGSTDLERVLAAAEEPPPGSDPTDTGAGAAPPPGTQMTGYGSQELRDIAEARRQQGGDLAPPGPGELVGAADDAEAGASRIAGRGTQALEGDPTDIDAQSAIDDVLAVRGRERDDGRRIDVELASEVGWDDYDTEAFRVGAWVATNEAAIIADTSHPAYRPLLGRYFVPSHETVNHTRQDDP